MNLKLSKIYCYPTDTVEISIILRHIHPRHELYLRFYGAFRISLAKAEIKPSRLKDSVFENRCDYSIH